MHPLISQDNLPKPPFGLPFFVAHTPPKVNGRQSDGPWHSLPEHLRDVARKAAESAETFGGQALAEYVGLLHDLGKFDPTFQRYLWRCYLHGLGRGPKPQPGEAPHKQAGTLVAWNAMPNKGGPLNPAELVAQIIFGHHSGMVNRVHTFSKASEAQKRAELTVLELSQRARLHSADLIPELPP